MMAGYEVQYGFGFNGLVLMACYEGQYMAGCGYNGLALMSGYESQFGFGFIGLLRLRCLATS
jgi:hypothetical protein